MLLAVALPGMLTSTGLVSRKKIAGQLARPVVGGFHLVTVD
jgi:hypothetical protein